MGYFLNNCYSYPKNTAFGGNGNRQLVQIKKTCLEAYCKKNTP
jgi:hypothetical protein